MANQIVEAEIVKLKDILKSHEWEKEYFELGKGASASIIGDSVSDYLADSNLAITPQMVAKACDILYKRDNNAANLTNWVRDHPLVNYSLLKDAVQKEHEIPVGVKDVRRVRVTTDLKIQYPPEFYTSRGTLFWRKPGQRGAFVRTFLGKPKVIHRIAMNGENAKAHEKDIFDYLMEKRSSDIDSASIDYVFSRL